MFGVFRSGAKVIASMRRESGAFSPPTKRRASKGILYRPSIVLYGQFMERKERAQNEIRSEFSIAYWQ